MKCLIVFLLTVTLYFTFTEAKNCDNNYIIVVNKLGDGGGTVDLICKNLKKKHTVKARTRFRVGQKENWQCRLEVGSTRLFYVGFKIFTGPCGEKHIYTAKFDGIYYSKTDGFGKQVPEKLYSLWKKKK